MTRRQVTLIQITVAVVVAVALAVAVLVRAYLTSFSYQVRLGTLVEATLVSSDGSLPTWKDPAVLAEIRAALPRYKGGPGYVPYVHAHANIGLVLRDDRGTQITLELPVDEGALVSVAARPPRMPQGNCWPMPRLLAVVARHGLPALAAQKMEAPFLKQQMQYWQDTFGGGREQSV